MVITQPTVDDFSDTTVMRVIRKIVNYICNNLVNGINNNDIVSGQFSVQGNQLSGTLTKGDGTTIDIPAATLPSGGGGSDNPYPTAVSMTLSGTTLNFNMTMSSGTPIAGSVNLAPILEGYVTDTELQNEISGLKLSSSNNNITLNGNSVSIVKSVSGQVTNGNLKITVNGVESGDIPLPDSAKIYVQNPYHFNSNIKTFSHRNEYCIECYKKSDMEGNFYSVGNIITSVELSSQYYYEDPIEYDLYWASINDTDTVNIFKHIIPDYASLEDGEYRISMYAMLPDSNMLYAMAGYGDVRLIKSGESITSGVGRSYIFTELETITTDAIVIITAMDKVN